MADRDQERDRLREQRLAADAADQRSTEQRRRRVQYLSIAAFLAAAVIVVLIVISQSGGGDSGGDVNIEGAAGIESELKGIPQNGTVLGRADAPVTVVEFGDLQCPACAQFSQTVSPDLIAGQVRSGEVNYDFRLRTIIGPDSEPAAKAALAASLQGRYWQYVDLFYLNQGTENAGYVTDDFLEALARAAGVADIDKWNRDRESSRWDSVIAANSDEANAQGLSGTPGILVEGPGGKQPLRGGFVPTLQQVQAAIAAVS